MAGIVRDGADYQLHNSRQGVLLQCDEYCGDLCVLTGLCPKSVSVWRINSTVDPNDTHSCSDLALMVEGAAIHIDLQEVLTDVFIIILMIGGEHRRGQEDRLGPQLSLTVIMLTIGKALTQSHLVVLSVPDFDLVALQHHHPGRDEAVGHSSYSESLVIQE